MSLVMTLVSMSFAPLHTSGYAFAHATAAAASNTTAVSTSSMAASVASAVSTTPAFLTVALPIAVSVVAVLTAGMTIDMIQTNRKMKKKHIVTIPTVFSNADTLKNAIFAYDKEEKCEMTETDEGTICVRFEYEDFVFQMNRERGFYDLIIGNANTDQVVKQQIDALQLEYIQAVRTATYEGLLQKIQANGWKIEEDTEYEDGSRYISILV